MFKQRKENLNQNKIAKIMDNFFCSKLTDLFDRSFEKDNKSVLDRKAEFYLKF